MSNSESIPALDAFTNQLIAAADEATEKHLNQYREMAEKHPELKPVLIDFAILVSAFHKLVIPRDVEPKPASMVRILALKTLLDPLMVIDATVKAICK